MSYTGGTIGEWIYQPPGQTTQIYRTDFGAKFFRSTGTTNPYMFTGIYSYRDWQWAQIQGYTSDVTHHWNATFGTSRPGPQAVGFGLASFGTTSWGQWRDAYMGAAIITLTDPEPPSLNSPAPTGATGANGWAKAGDTLAFSAQASDPGLGVRRFRLTNGLGAPLADSGIWCNGSKDYPCAAQAQLSANYSNQLGSVVGGQSNAAPLPISADGLPEGANVPVTLTAIDALGGTAEGHDTARTHYVKVDKADPAIDVVEGTLKPEDREWVGAGTQTLSIDGRDSGSGIVAAEVKVDSRRVGTPYSKECPEGHCGLEWDPDINTDDLDPTVSGDQPLTPGPHTLTVTVTDAAGRSKSVSWNIRHDREAPALVVGGTLKAASGQPLDPSKTYSVSGDATDGASGLGEVEVQVDSEPDNGFEEQQCLGGGCLLHRDFSYRQDDYGEGEHAVDVVATDRAGNETRERVNVADSPISKLTCPAPAAAASEPGADTVSPDSALALLQSSQGLPRSVGTSTALDLNGTNVQPTLGHLGGAFRAASTLNDAKVDDTAGDGASWTVPTSQGPVCLTPLTVGADASDPVTPTGGDGVLFANSRAGADSVFRATPVGLEVFHQLRSAAAPEQFEWKVDLPAGTELRSLPDGSAAVVQPVEPGTEPADSGASPAAQTPAEQRAQIGSTASELSAAIDDRSRLEGPRADVVEAVIRRPSTKDAAGDDVPTSLSVNGSTLTLSIDHRSASRPYPLVSDLAVSDAEAVDEGSAQKSLGESPPMSDAEAEGFDTSGAPEGSSDQEPTASQSSASSDAAADYADASKDGAETDIPGDASQTAARPDLEARAFSAASLASNLGNLTIGFSDSNARALTKPDYGLLSDKNGGNKQYLRVFVPWNYMRIKERMWDGLGAGSAHVPGVKDRMRGRSNTAVMVVFSANPPPTSEHCKTGAPDAKGYGDQIEAFLRANRFVKQITAWNEPNFRPNQTASNSGKAASYWKKAQAICNRTKWCADVPAGDFAGGFGKPSYIESYRRRLMRGLTASQRPRIWSFHAYGDALRAALRGKLGPTSTTMAYRKRYSSDLYKRGSSKPRIWNTEQSAFYRLDCLKIKDPEARSKYCQGKAALRVGAQSQARAGAQLLREAIKPVPDRTPVTRFYYYDLQDTVGFVYPGGGQSGRCTNTGTPICNEVDVGLLGSDVDGAATPTDKPTRDRPGLTTTAPNARRRLWCLFRRRLASDVRNGSVRSCQ